MGQTFELESAPNRANGNVSGDDRMAIATYMVELDDMRSRVTTFETMDPGEILATIAGIAGRLTEIRAALYRSNSQRATALRTREVDPLRDDLDLQFRLWSRKIHWMEWEYQVAGGGV